MDLTTLLPIADVLHQFHEPPRLQSLTTTGWHGTSREAAESIVSNGVDWSRVRDDEWSPTRSFLGEAFYLFGECESCNCSGVDAAVEILRSRSTKSIAVLEVAIHEVTVFETDEPENQEFWWRWRTVLIENLTDATKDELFRRNMIDRYLYEVLREAHKDKRIGAVRCLTPNLPSPGKEHCVMAIYEEGRESIGNMVIIEINYES